MYEAHHVLSYANLLTLLLGTSEQFISFITPRGYSNLSWVRMSGPKIWPPRYK